MTVQLHMYNNYLAMNVTEIAAMISGASVTELTRQNAKEMIEQNQRLRE